VVRRLQVLDRQGYRSEFELTCNKLATDSAFLGATSRVESLLARVKVHWWLFIAGRKRKRQQFAETLGVLQKVIALQPHRAHAFVQAGYCLARLSRHEEALHYYEGALQVASNYGEAHAYIGKAYYDLGRKREALEGLVNGNAEQWEQSLEAFTKLTESNGRNGSAWEGLGRSLAHLNRDSEALAPLQRAIQLNAQNAPPHYELGNSRAQCGHQPYPCRTGNVVGGLYTAEEEQEGDANRELWLWLRICIRNGPRPFLLHQGKIGILIVATVLTQQLGHGASSALLKAKPTRI
jgi:tetratricopeptide (TPR) repeat protein